MDFYDICFLLTINMFLGCYSNCVIILCHYFALVAISISNILCLFTCLVGCHHFYKLRLVMLTVTYPNIIIFLYILSRGDCTYIQPDFAFILLQSPFFPFFLSHPHTSILAIKLYVLCNSMANKIKYKPYHVHDQHSRLMIM